jgi:glucose-1-phosphate adenylyltransferase
VRRSVLGPGVLVEEGATVTDSVLFADVVVRAGASVDWSILDVRTVVGAKASVGSADAEGGSDADHITLVGQDVRISEGASVELGARLQPRETV